MLVIKSKEFREFVEQKINSYIRIYHIWKTDDGTCFLPIGDEVEIYESVDEFIEKA